MYLIGTLDEIRVIGINEIKIFSTMIYDIHSVHTTMRSNKPGMMVFGKAILHGKSSKQKCNVMSSTK